MTVIDSIIAEYAGTPRIVAALRKKRWLLLSEPDDVRQCVEVARLKHPDSERLQARELAYLLVDLEAQPHAGQSLRKPPKKLRKPKVYVPNGRPHSRPPKGHAKYGGHVWTPEEAREMAKLATVGRRKAAKARRLARHGNRRRWTAEEARALAPIGAQARIEKLGPERVREIAVIAGALGTRTANLPAPRRREIGQLAICRRWHGGDGTDCYKCERARARRGVSDDNEQ